MFVFPKKHVSSISLILNPTTKRISPHFHVIFDDFLQTLRSITDFSDLILDNLYCDYLFISQGTEEYFDHNDSHLVHDMYPEWLTPEEILAHCPQMDPNS